MSHFWPFFILLNCNIELYLNIWGPARSLFGEFVILPTKILTNKKPPTILNNMVQTKGRNQKIFPCCRRWFFFPTRKKKKKKKSGLAYLNSLTDPQNERIMVGHEQITKLASMRHFHHSAGCGMAK